MKDGIIGLVSSHFMESDREPMSGRLVVDEEEEFYDFLPFQKEFLIPLRDRAFSWDVSFEDEIHGDNEAQAISVISEQQDSHRLVIKAKASNLKRQAETKEAVVEAAEPAPKKGKAAANNKKKDGSAVTSPVPQAGKPNVKITAGSSSSGSSSSSTANGKPQSKAGGAAANATGSATKNTTAAAPSAKAAAAARKIFNVASSPSSEMLDTQTLRNTLSNAKSSADKSEFASIKNEFSDILNGNSLPFGFGNEFEIGTGSRRNSVAFDDALSLHFKQEDDFTDLADETFGEEFRPPRKLSWSIDFNAIEAAMGGTLMNPIEGSYQAAGADPSMSYQNSYAFDQSGLEGGGVFPSLLRASEATGSTAGIYTDPTGASGSNMSHANTAINKNNPSATVGIINNNVASGGMGPSSYLHSNGSADHSGASSSGSHPSGAGQGNPSMMSAAQQSMMAKNNDRDQLASLMSGALNPSHPHTLSSGLTMSGSAYANSLSQSHASGLGNNPGMMSNGDSTMSSSVVGVGGLTLGGLTVPNDGEFRVGAYTKLERHLKIEAFREKKRTRIWRKQIKYDCRKRLADTRPRVKGRFVSRKGDKGGPEGDDMDGGPDGMDGPDGLPGMGPGGGVGPGMGQGGPRPPHMMQGGPMSSGGNGQNNGPGMSNPNMHHMPHGAHNSHNVHGAHNTHAPHGGVHNTQHGAHGVHNTHNAHGGAHGGMHKIATNTSYLSSGNLGGGDHNSHGAGGLSSSMMGIKTEMKYSGAHSHALQNSHLQQQSHQSHQQQGHAGHNLHGSHSLPSIPRMDNVYNPSAGTTSNSVGGPHLSGVRPGMVGSLSASSSSGAGSLHSHGPPHSLLSQAQQQKLQQQQALAQNALQQHHLQQQALLQQQQQQAQAQHGQGQGQGQVQTQAKLHPHTGPQLGQGSLTVPTLQSGSSLQTGASLQVGQPGQGMQGSQGGALATHAPHVPLQAPSIGHGANLSLNLNQQGQGMSAPLVPQNQTLAPAHPHVPPSGLLLSGPSAAHLHSTGSTAATTATSSTPHGLAALPSVAGHTAPVTAPGPVSAPAPASASVSLAPPNFSSAPPPRQG